ncbi:GGDEF domain protein [Brucella abortus A13334]|nr:GGDEF domain protein [Brucella abortus A13334]
MQYIGADLFSAFAILAFKSAPITGASVVSINSGREAARGQA